jgi:hypothetical protein
MYAQVAQQYMTEYHQNMNRVEVQYTPEGCDTLHIVVQVAAPLSMEPLAEPRAYMLVEQQGGGQQVPSQYGLLQQGSRAPARHDQQPCPQTGHMH